MTKKIEDILNYLDELYPNAHCELNYNKDYELLIAIVLSAQTTDKRVNKVTKILFDKYSTLEALSNAPIEEIEQIIKEIGTFKKKSIFVKNIATSLLKDCNGIVPNNPKYLETLSGVGRKTINVFLSEYYSVPRIAVDTHVERVSKRLGFAEESDDVLVVEKKLTKLIPDHKLNKMHHQILLFGRHYCKARAPFCDTCKLTNFELDRQLYDAINEFEQYKATYPVLMTSESFVKIDAGLTETETEIYACRKYYNDIVTDYNEYIRTFPSNIVGKLCHLKQRTYFDGKDMNDDILNDFKL